LDIELKKYLYDKIDNEIIWGAIIRYLPVLKIEIAKLNS